MSTLIISSSNSSFFLLPVIPAFFPDGFLKEGALHIEPLFSLDMSVILPFVIFMKVQQEITSFLEQDNRVLFAYIHGSFLDGGEYNDIDIAVMLTDERHIMQTELDMESSMALECSLPAQPDVRALNRAPVQFRYAVLARGELLFTRSDDVLSDFKEQTFRSYLDNQYLYSQYLAGRTA